MTAIVLHRDVAMMKRHFLSFLRSAACPRKQYETRHRNSDSNGATVACIAAD